MDYIDQNELDYDDGDDAYPHEITCEITTVIWGQEIQYSVDRHINRQGAEYNICVSINDSYGAEDLGQGFEGQALESLRRGVAVGVTRWVLSIPLSDGVYRIFMYNDDVHPKGFTKIAKRLGFVRIPGSKYCSLAVIKDGKACQWRTRWTILKAGLATWIEKNQAYLEEAYYVTKYKMRKKRNESNK